jgi:hypothetical protein
MFSCATADPTPKAHESASAAKPALTPAARMLTFASVEKRERFVISSSLVN